MNKDGLTNEHSCPKPYHNCDSKVTKSETLSECESWCKTPYGICGPLVAKVPVVLADCKIQIDVEAEIHLDEPAFDIKTVDKKVCITQCHVVPHSNKLFLAGYVQKNIQYSTVRCANKSSLSGDVLHTTVRTPFNCVSEICFKHEPSFGKSHKSRSNVLDKNMVCIDDGEDSWEHFNKPSEPIFCELEWFKILETDIYDRDFKGYAVPFAKEALFQDLTEKMIVLVGIKVLQKKSVYLPEPTHVDYMDDHDAASGKNIEVGYEEGKGVVGRAPKAD